MADSFTTQADSAFADATAQVLASQQAAETKRLHQNAFAVVPFKYTGPAVVDIGKLSRLLYFRQSMLHDYMTCPQMAYYRWIAGLEQTRAQFLSAFLGTAGHEVLYLMHSERKFNYTWLELLERFEVAFHKAVNASPVAPKLGANFRSIEEQLRAKQDEYVAMLEGYQLDPRNHKLYSIMQEQPFVLEVESNDRKYLYTGCIDMGALNESAQFKLRDYKFRENTFKPNKTQLDLEAQFTLYALGVVHGYPACDACRPRYEGGSEDDALAALSSGKIDGSNTKSYEQTMAESELHVVYDGPCDQCRAKIAGKKWPKRYPDPCELVWMRDYKRHEKDQYEQYVPDQTKPKIKGGKKGTSWVYQRKLNPEYGQGYKKGDYVGRCIYPTYRDPNLLKTLLGDILRMCDAMLRGEFFRRPGEQCAFWCHFKDPCLADVKAELNERHLIEAESFGSTTLED